MTNETKTEPNGERRNRSAACGAWSDHDACLGTVQLPAPDDVCSCPCHAAV